jgi:hypothetical protein
VARSSLDLSDRAVLGPLAELLAAVRSAAGKTSLLLIGAAARDLLLVHAHGIDPVRATEDTDVALAVDGWNDFQRVREALVRSGQFTADVSRIVCGMEINAWTSFHLAVWNDQTGASNGPWKAGRSWASRV